MIRIISGGKKIVCSCTEVGIAMVQIATYIAFSRILRYFFRADRKVSRTISQLRRGSLIISNHQSILDPFIILAHLPTRSFLKAVPIRFPVTHSYYKYLRFLALFGAYDIGADKRERMLGLFYTRDLLKSGESVMIFPEGRICAAGEMLDFQNGIKFLTDVSANVVFVKMEGFYQKDWLKFQMLRGVIFSEVRYFNGEQEDPENIRVLMKKLSAH
ncbi:MAG: lysophospholipid acyltransferase family protein [Candidatus Moraniibacteriota bacterium]